MQSLGFTTTRAPGKDRWTEIEIFARPGGGYVVATRGRSTVPGERTRERRIPCPDAPSVAFALARFSAPAEAAIHAAATKDPALAKVAGAIWE